MRVLGALIAGGRSSRFGGDKALAMLAGQPLIAHAAAALAAQVGGMVVCGRAWGELPSLTDLPAPDLGPLAGIAAALAHAEQDGFERVLTVGCDMPSIPSALLATLIEQAPAWCDDAPILGCWPAALAGSLRAHLASGGDRSIRRWGGGIGGTAVPSPAPLPNLNTPADLAMLEQAW